MILKNKNAVIYGAGGSLGSAIAKAFARAGAAVYITGVNVNKIEKLATQINDAGGKAYAAQVDALHKDQVEAHLQSINSSIDISFNAIGWKDVQGSLLTELSVDDFMSPIGNGLTTNFITATAAAKVMMEKGNGVILTLTATPGGIGYANVGGFGPACSALESLVKDLASEIGPWGVRVVNIRSAGSPDSEVFQAALKENPEIMKGLLEKMTNDTMLKQLPLMEEIAQTAVFLVSDMASKITGCTIDVTAGTTQALNYKVTPIAFLKR
ncbi:MAG: SDR family oxidoreductase [Rhizobacter sp.]|nr:SDR family oxidoreductase [Ferruginibacter sp.]